MNEKSTFKKYYDRLAKEGLLRSALWAFVYALALYCVLLFVAWCVDADWMLWLSVGLAGALLLGLFPLLYLKKYRPTTKAIAARVDALGLEERLITMTELMGDESFMAMRQREDALASLAAVQPRQVKLSVSVLGLVLAFVMFACGAGMTVVSVLAAGDIIDNPIHSIIDPPKPKDVYYQISYRVVTVDGNNCLVFDMGGLIEGNEDQLLLDGEETETVEAIADEEYGFAMWSDGLEEASRSDILDVDVLYETYGDRIEELLKEWEEEQASQEEPSDEKDPSSGGYEDVFDPTDPDWDGTAPGWDTPDAGGDEDPEFFGNGLDDLPEPVSVNEYGEVVITYYAVFGQLGEGSGDPSEGGGDESDPDKPQDQPQESQDSQEGDDQEQDDQQQEEDQPGSDESGGRYDESNQIIDGEQYYRDRLQEYYEQAMAIIEAGGEVPDYLREIIEKYYGVIV